MIIQQPVLGSYFYHNTLDKRMRKEALTIAGLVDVAGFRVTVDSTFARHLPDRSTIRSVQTSPLSVLVSLVTILTAFAPRSPRTPVSVVCT